MIPSSRGTGDESECCCAAVPVKSLLVCLLSGISADRKVCTTVALALLLLGTTSHSAIGNRES